MAAVEPLCRLIGINTDKLSRAESFIIEAELITRLYEELKEIFRQDYKEYFRLMKFSPQMEDAMLEESFIKLVIKDILATEEYTLDGIANYIGTHEDVVSEVVVGRNTSPSITVFRKIIELHRSVRSEIYREVMRKIAEEYVENY